jgi:hypothetical protein
MQTTINFFEGSYQFDSVATTLNVAPDYIEFKLAKAYEHRPTTETLWATVSQGGSETARFTFQYGQGLTQTK